MQSDTESANNTHTESALATRPIIQVPATPDDLLPPRAADEITEAANLLRDNWEQVAPLYLSAAGLTASINGSPKWDEADAIFQLKGIAKENGHKLLAQLNTAEFAWACLWGYRRISGHSLRAIQQQGRQLLLEARRALTQQRAAE